MYVYVLTYVHIQYYYEVKNGTGYLEPGDQGQPDLSDNATRQSSTKSPVSNKITELEVLYPQQTEVL